ncbi:hypothetical protein D0T50_01425 [Bacteroides sp. 214]|uniref:YjbH domain-containing protein n=1 Tax=Bacteroides sp. 214 TaxID=2302935 RepID=UPI0013D61EDA|nr:YjbH domain-containing protein [Bacteroides sp. 214]NDW11546.1 hypothetical protein [Bacteroides sp. 214]
MNIKYPNINCIKQYRTFVFLLCLFSVEVYSQSADTTVDVLIGMGFENVSWTEDEEERVYVLENASYRSGGVGIGKAIDKIQEFGMPENKVCRVIVLDNNVPVISLKYQPVENARETQIATRHDWDVSHDLGDSWEKIRKQKVKNSSLFKIDVVVYPDFSFQNYIITQIYQVLLNINPAVEISMWKGMKLTGQVIIPVVNDYGPEYKQVRQGYITLAQTMRLPYNTFVTGTVGTFNNNRWGGDLSVKHFIPKNEQFSLEGKIGYTGVSYFKDWVWHASPLKRLTWTVGANYYWTKYNTQLSVKVEQYLYGEKGVRVDFMRMFRYAAIGFYAMKTEAIREISGDAKYSKTNGGFYFQVMLPPYGKYKRNKVRITTAKYMGILYNAGNERYYGKSYTPRLGSNYAYEINYNPYFIKSELSNF